MEQQKESEETKGLVQQTFKQIYLFPSDYFASRLPYQVTTVLGTCVSITLYDFKLKIGGINHFMLPNCPENEVPTAKYGDKAIQLLLNKMLHLGCVKKNIQAKVIGGADRISSVNHQFKIGERNVELAFNWLENEKIPIIGKSIGGNKGRKLFFYTNTGEVLMKLIKNIELADFEEKIIQNKNYITIL